MSSTSGKYGARYWCVTRTDGTGWYIYADYAKLHDTGILIFYRADPELPTVAFAQGEWTHFFAASLVDGSPVALDECVPLKTD